MRTPLRFRIESDAVERSVGVGLEKQEEHNVGGRTGWGGRGEAEWGQITELETWPVKERGFHFIKVMRWLSWLSIQVLDLD